MYQVLYVDQFILKDVICHICSLITLTFSDWCSFTSPFTPPCHMKVVHASVPQNILMLLMHLVMQEPLTPALRPHQTTAPLLVKLVMPALMPTLVVSVECPLMKTRGRVVVVLVCGDGGLLLALVCKGGCYFSLFNGRAAGGF